MTRKLHGKWTPDLPSEFKEFLKAGTITKQQYDELIDEYTMTSSDKYDKLLKILESSSKVVLSCDHRRCETDTSGVELASGRDHYRLWTWKVDNQENEWPGFWHAEAAVEDMITKTTK